MSNSISLCVCLYSCSTLTAHNNVVASAQTRVLSDFVTNSISEPTTSINIFTEKFYRSATIKFPLSSGVWQRWITNYINLTTPNIPCPIPFPFIPANGEH